MQGIRDRARDLRDLDRMSQPVPEMVGDAGREHLCLVFQAAEGAGMDDPVAIALEFVPIRMWEFGISPATSLASGETQTAEAGHFFEGGSCATASMAALLTLGRVLVRRGSSILRALSGSEA